MPLNFFMYNKFKFSSQKLLPEVLNILSIIKQRDPHQPEFIQAASELLYSIQPALSKEPKYASTLSRLVEPERVIQFRVPWTNDKGETMVNRGFRVQFSSAIGPYKGGLRFHPSVNLSIMKFLAFEQIFKNALTGLPMGGGKGGSDFDPKGKSDKEIMGFCQSFMNELYRHIGPNIDVPAGDIGVGAREIGYLFGQYKRISNEFSGTLTGKGLEYGGSLLRPEATGYGLVWFAEEMLKEMKKETLEGKKVLVSGSGNVAQYCVQALMKHGAKAITLSDSNGVVYEENGFNQAQFEWIMDLKNERRGRISEYTKFSKTAKYFDKEKPWKLFKADIALPCATENEINGNDVDKMKENGIYLVAEGSNMPSTISAIQRYKDLNILYGPAKASNAGGVACSGLEMSQNSLRLSWKEGIIEKQLKGIMANIFNECYTLSEKYGEKGNLQLGANVGGFVKVAKAMLAEGCV